MTCSQLFSNDPLELLYPHYSMREMVLLRGQFAYALLCRYVGGKLLDSLAAGWLNGQWCNLCQGNQDKCPFSLPTMIFCDLRL